MSIPGREFIFHTLCPQVLAIASDDVTDFLKANNFNSLADILDPFGKDIPIQGNQ